jgi:hypothetical protein
MHTSYVAYGLQLSCSFPLPGMRPQTTEGLPRLTIELISPQELDSCWSGADGPAQWRGTLGDGSSLTLHQGVGGDTLFTNGRRARYRLDSTSNTLQCAPWREGQSWQQTLLGRILPNLSIIAGYEALHASAVESPVGVVAVAAPSGMGKTTLALELMRRGWPLVADDVLTLAGGAALGGAALGGAALAGESPLVGGSGGVQAHPGTPHMNVAPIQFDLAREISTTLGILGGEHWVAARTTATGARPLRLVCMLTRAPNLSLEARVLPASPLPLTPYMLGLKADSERERRRFALYAELASSATLLRLSSGTNESQASLADQIEQVLADTATGAPLGSPR